MVHLNYLHLKYFWVVAHEGQVNRAAERLRVSAPTVSSQIRSLEDALGVQLFDRSRRTFALTPAGRRILAYADQIFSLGDELVALAEDANRPDATRPLRVGVCHDVPEEAAYRLMTPGIEVIGAKSLVRCERASVDRLLVDASTNALDIVITASPTRSAEALDLRCQPLGMSELSLMVAPSLRTRVPAPALVGHEPIPLLLPCGPSALRSQVERWCAQNAWGPRIVGEFNDIGLMRRCGAAGLGVFPVSRNEEAEVAQVHGVELYARLAGATECYFAVTPANRVLGEAVLAILQGSQADAAAAS